MAVLRIETTMILTKLKCDFLKALAPLSNIAGSLEGLKIREGGARSNLVEIGLTDLPNLGGGGIAPPPPGSESPVL
jgi:hypothetical protein